ncbi:MAG TPA: hypothetical protein VJV78_20035 [Polyangiales bacterium]|nr:hypothetical protein [Polyangiales bacterium]
MHRYSVIGVALALAGAGCASTQTERVRDARMEQVSENADAREKATDANATAREDSIKQQHEAAHDNIAAANPPAEGASQELVKVSEERATYQTEAKARLDKLGIRIDAASQKLSVLGTRAPTALRDELKTTSTEYQSLERDVNSLNQTPTTSWEATTARIDQRLKSLDARVTNLSDHIEDV